MYYVIVNPHAGKQNMMRTLQTIKTVLGSFSKTCEEHILYQVNGDAQDGEIICSHLKNADQTEAVIVVGGDGTVSKVINWLMAAHISVPIGIIPLEK